MRKNAIALAVGALCIAPAAQAQIVFGNDAIGTMQIYGKLYPEFIWGESKGATATGSSVSTLASPTGVCGTSGSTGGCTGASNGSRFAVDSQNSYLGFRGERRLGSTGLKGIWQIEQSVELDTGDSSATFSNRNSFLGLAGGFGTVKLGHMDTIYKEYGQQTDMFGLTSGNFISPSNVLSQIGVGSNSSARFHERASNTIQYQTPEFAGGFQAGLQYAPDETRNDIGNTLNKQLWSMGVKWEKGPMYLSAQHEIHKDFFGGSNNVSSTLSNAATAGAHSRDTAWRLSAAYDMGMHKIGADISRLKWSETGQAAGVKFDEYQHVTWGVSLESKWGGPWRTAFEWVHGAKGSCSLTGGASCSTDGLTGDLYGAGLAYDLDKQTFLFALAAELKNGASARYDNWAASSVTRGSDVTQAAVGMAYKF